MKVDTEIVAELRQKFQLYSGVARPKFTKILHAD